MTNELSINKSVEKDDGKFEVGVGSVRRIQNHVLKCSMLVSGE